MRYARPTTMKSPAAWSHTSPSFPVTAAALRRAAGRLTRTPNIAKSVRKAAKLAADPDRFFLDFFARRIAERATFRGAQWQQESLRENGFYVVRGLFERDECARIAAILRAQCPTNGGSFTSIDASNRHEVVRDLLFDQRVVHAVEAGLGTAPKFLQASDLQIDHDHTRWHRDSAYRDPSGLDWDEATTPYRVVKIIVYLESDTAGLAVQPGSHASATDTHEAITARLQGDPASVIIGPRDEANRRYSASEREHAVVLCAGVGDAIVFDERLLHRGRRVDEGRITNEKSGRKLTVSWVLGADNVHSERFYSYFRYARPDLVFKEMAPALRTRLTAAGLSLRNGYGNHYEANPDTLRGVWLRRPGDIDDLVERFRRDHGHGRTPSPAS